MKEVRQQGARRVTSWRSPELGCVELRRLEEFQDEHCSVLDESDLRAVRVLLGEPAAARFGMPDGYENVSWSGYHGRLAQAKGSAVQKEDMKRFAFLDAAWEKHKIDDAAQAGRTPPVAGTQ